MKKRVYLFLTLTFIFIFSSVIPVFASQPSPIIGNKLVGGVANRQYYFDPSNRSVDSDWWVLDYTHYIRRAMNGWINTTNIPGVITPISFVETSTKIESEIDFYTIIDHDFLYPGITWHYVGNSDVSRKGVDWTWCKVQFNGFTLNVESYDTRIPKAAAHEIGHCFGLDENEIPGSVMYKIISGIISYRPSVEDCNAINRIYP